MTTAIPNIGGMAQGTAERPAAGPPRAYHFPAFERRVLANGLRLIVAPVHRLPLVTVSAVVEAGAITEPREKAGLAELTTRSLLEGAGEFNGEALTEQLEQLGTSIEVKAGWDVTLLSMTVLAQQLQPAVARFADVLTVPHFPESGIARLAGERIADIMQVESEPRELADEQFERFVYVEGSRYRTPAGGTKASVAALTRPDVTAFYEARYTPAATTIIVVGDITVDVAESLVAGVLGTWNGAPPARHEANDRPASNARQIHIVRRPDAPQSEIRVGHVGVPYRHPDYFNITVMNAVLGGLFGSRINLNLREAHGYTYGARSTFDWRRNAGPFVISTAVANNVTAPAIHEIFVEIDRMRTESISDSELTLATNYLDGVFPIRFESTVAVANALATLVTYDLDTSWYSTYRERIRAVTTNDVLRAAHQYLHPDQAQVVVVGDPAAIREPLEALGIAPVDVSGEAPGEVSVV